MPYADRAKVSFDVTESDTLGDVIDQAAEQFGVTPASGPGVPVARRVSEAIDCVSFYRPSDERGGGSYDVERWSRAIRLVDDHGRPSWVLRWSEIRMAELLASAESGLVDGDPLRPYLWPVIPQGESLAQLADALWIVWMWWGQALTARETLRLAREGLRRVRGGQQVAHADPAAWAKAFRRPDELVPFLHEQPRTTAEVMRETGFSEDGAKGALWGMGFTLRDDGRWVPGGDPIATALHEGMMSIESLGRAPTELEIEVTVRALFRQEA